MSDAAKKGMTLPVPVPRPSYSQARENLVKAVPPKIICLLACGGRDCRYEGPACWRPGQQAVRGVFSTWVTDGIVAMARPSTHLIKRYGIIEQFQELKIKSIINMQLPGEHAHCGPPLELESGFTYSPQIFMENGIFFYNFGMPDFGVSSPAGMLDAVKVLAFAVKEGRVAVHCHAGLGRTGVLIACYLIYTLRVSPSEAIHYVRIKRPRSIQTRAQIHLVFQFARLLAPQRAQYPGVAGRHSAPFSLQQYLLRQRLLLHGHEARRLRHLPKIVHFLCGRLAAMVSGRVLCPAAGAELERRRAVLEMTASLRETLMAQKLLPVPQDPRRPRNSCVGSVSSWDDPEGFLERKREVLRNKRSYSDSDLCKIDLSQDQEFVLTPVKEIPKDIKLGCQENYQKLAGTSLDSRKDQCNGDAKAGGVPSTLSRGIVTRSSAKKTKCTTKKNPAFPKFSSNVELSRPSSSVPALESQVVAKAMAEQDPPGEDVLLRVALLQGELNTSESSWAMLVVEQDPVVLSALLWSWLEKLTEPVLNREDVERITTGTQDVCCLGTLQTAQDQTISCMLRCVGQVTGLCSHLEGAVLGRLVRALTRCSPDDMKQYATLIQVFKAIARQYHCHGSCPGVMSNAAKLVENSN